MSEMLVHAAAAATFAFVGVALKAMQQLNVVHHKILWIMPVSVGMGYCETAIIVKVAGADVWWIFLPIGLGGGLGCIFSMLLHRRLRRKPGLPSA